MTEKEDQGNLWWQFANAQGVDKDIWFAADTFPPPANQRLLYRRKSDPDDRENEQKPQ